MAAPEQRSEDIYEALPTSCSLRLLNLARLPEDHAYGLETFEIGQCPPYSTMSYTWGPPLNTKQCEEDYTRDSHRVITLLTSRGKGHLSIGRNLYEGLQKVLPEVQYLWVDAICINQNDTAERSIQVPLMGSIYADANSVLVWLGLDESNVADFKWIHEVFYAALLAFAGKDDIQNFAWTPGVDSPLADRTLQVHATPRWQGYADFVAERRWFRRAWIFQEISLSQKILVFVGSSNISWDAMTAISWYLERSGLALVIEVSSDRKQRLGFECHSLNISRQSASKCSPELEAWNAYYGYIAGSFEPKTGQLWIGDSELERWHGYALLVTGMLRYYEATVPHDMVYGMLGLLERQCPPDFQLPIRADYEQSSRDLYMSTAFYFIKHTASLAALSLIGDPKEGLMSDLPSWVLDFSSPQRTGALSMLHIEGRPLTTCGVCVGSPESRKLSGATLELEGAYFDEVIEVTSDGWAFDGMPADLRCLEGALHIVGKRTTYSKPPINLLAEVLLCGAENLYAPPGLLKTLGTNGEENGEASIFRSKDSALFLRGWARKVVVMADSSGFSYKSVLEAMKTLEKQDLRSAGTLFSTEVQETINAVKSIGIQPDDQESLRVINTMLFLSDTFIVEAIKNILTKKLYRTSKGCIGFGKSTMEVGDQVWMLCGGRTPFILRPALEDERYTLIGETYLHGFMQGEMITEELKARIKPVYLI